MKVCSSGIDINGFLSVLRAYGSIAVEDVVIRYVLSRILSLTHHVNTLPYWLSLTEEAFRRGNVLFIVLDACRFDFFSVLAPRYFYGRLIATRSEGTYLPRWLPSFLKMASQSGNARIYRATCSIRPHDLSFKNFCTSIGQAIELIELKPKGIGISKLVVQPVDVNGKVLELGLKSRTIIWYMQPHFPWITCPEVSKNFIFPFMLYEFAPATVIKKYMDGIKKDSAIECYHKNLLMVLRAVRGLLEELDRERKVFSRYRVIITADHGELLGEYGLLFHPPNYRLPQLIIVPWMEVHGLT